MNKFKLFLLAILPGAITLLLAIIYAMPKRIEGLAGVMPLIHLIPVFIWTVMQPRDMRLLFVAILGLFVDLATSLPLALTGLSYAMFVMMIRSQRKYIYREGFFAMWAYFSILLFGLQMLLWAFASAYFAVRMPMSAAIWQWFFTILLYPIFHALCYPLIEKMTKIRYRLQHA